MSDSQYQELFNRIERRDLMLRKIAHELSVLAHNVATGAEQNVLTETSNRISTIAQDLTSGLGGADQI